MFRIHSGSIPLSLALRGALVLVCGLGTWGCGSAAPPRPKVTPAEEARLRVAELRRRGGTLTHEQVWMVERLPFRASGPTDISRVLRDGIPRPSVPLGERRSVLEMYRGVEEHGAPPAAAGSQTGEDTTVDPKR